MPRPVRQVGDEVLAALTMAGTLHADNLTDGPGAVEAAIVESFALGQQEKEAVMARIAEEIAIQEAFDLDPEDTAALTLAAAA